MDKLSHYRSLIQKILTEYDGLCSQVATPNIETLLAFDEKKEINIYGFKSGGLQRRE
jgi:XisI protein